MAGSHCLICGVPIVSGLYCYDCLWEMKRIRLRTDENLDSWMELNAQPSKRVRTDEESTTLDHFSNQ